MKAQHPVSPDRARAPGWLVAPAIGIGLLVAPLSAVAQTAGAPVLDEASVTAPAYDPFEKANRGIFAFSMGLDHALIGPIAHAYMAVAPKPVRDRVSAFVYNLGEPGTVINDGLQGHPRRAGRAAGRFVLNTTVGLLGLFDVAAQAGLAAHDSDFGQTLGRYGVHPGPYLYIPIVGPLDVREGVGRVVDIATDPISLVTGGVTTATGATRTGLTGLDTRVQTDGAFRALEDATDPYATARSAYTQHRQYVVQQATGKVTDLPDFDSPPPSPPEPSHP